jgi:hypothetical protein
VVPVLLGAEVARTTAPAAENGTSVVEGETARVEVRPDSGSPAVVPDACSVAAVRGSAPALATDGANSVTRGRPARLSGAPAAAAAPLMGGPEPAGTQRYERLAGHGEAP